MSLSVNVFRSPFGVRAAQFAPSSNAVYSLTALLEAQADENYAQVESPSIVDPKGKRRNYAVGGARGIQQLVAHTRSSQGSLCISDTSPGAKEGGYASPTAPTVVPLILSKHERGRLLLWDSRSGRVIASRIFPATVLVHHCVMTASYVYTTVEGAAASVGSEEESCVYVWDRRGLQNVTVLRGHDARLTALAAWPMETATLIATASLDGSVRLWAHLHDRVEGKDKQMMGDPVRVLSVLSAADLGTVHSLRFLTTDTLVIAGTRSALAFVRFPEGFMNDNARASGEGVRISDSVPFQLARSLVDPDGGTTFLHVCRFNRSSGGGGTAEIPSLSSPTHVVSHGSSATTSTIYIVTGSTSGYNQEWSVDLDTTTTGDRGPRSPTAVSANTYVTVKCRWYHKAHVATVDSIVTDEDVVASTSLFDGARLYHRKTGKKMSITSTSTVVALVPQLKELVWGTADGVLTVSSYAKFASDIDGELELMWSAKPHAAAIRGLCVTLTPDLCGETLCTGAVDGSLCVWTSSKESRNLSLNASTSEKSSASPFGRFLDLLALPSAKTKEKTSAAADHRVAALMACLKSENGDDSAILVAEINALGELGTIDAIALKESQEVACAYFTLETNDVVSLWVGIVGGPLLYTMKRLSKKSWSPMREVQWDGKPSGTIAAIAFVTGTATVAAVVVEAPDLRQSSQRLVLSVLQRDTKINGPQALTPKWEGAVSLPYVFALTGSRERHVELMWMETNDRGRLDAPAATTGLLLRCSDGSIVRCMRKERSGEKGVDAWHAPEVIVVGSCAGRASSVRHNLDRTPTSLKTIVTAESSSSDLLSLDVFKNQKKVLVSSVERKKQLTNLLCDTGAEIVRLAAVRQEDSDVTSEVAFFDSEGRECYRVTYGGAVIRCGPAVIPAASNSELSYTAKKPLSSTRNSGMSMTADCTALVAHASERIVFIGYDDGLLQMVDSADMYVFSRCWATGMHGTATAITGVRYSGGDVVVVRLSDGHICGFPVLPRSLIDQSLTP